jgi:hypothetical protein
MTSLLRFNKRSLRVTEVIDLTQDDPISSDVGAIACDDLFPPALDGQSEYRVEQILECWQPDEEVQEFQFLVKWFGYPVSQATWEWEENLSNSRDAIAAFRQRR